MTKNRLNTKFYVLILFLAFLNACTIYSSNTRWPSRRQNHVNSFLPLNKKSVGVLFFEDSRDASKDYNSLFLGILPLISGSTRLYSYPYFPSYQENYKPLTTMPYLSWYLHPKNWHLDALDLSSHFGMVLYIETNNRKLFNRVMLAPNDKNLNSDYYIQGTLLNTSVLQEKMTHRVTLYLSDFLDITGLPYEEDTYVMKLNLKILDKNKNVVFDRIYWARPRKITITSYKSYTLAYRLMIFNEMIQEIYTQFFEDIKNIKF
jgi:hypothetical protein